MTKSPIIKLMEDINQGNDTDMHLLFDKMKDNGMELIIEPIENYDMNSLSDSIDNMIATYLRVKFNYTYTQIRELIEKYPKQMAYLITANIIHGINWDANFFKQYDISITEPELDKDVFKENPKSEKTDKK